MSAGLIKKDVGLENVFMLDSLFYTDDRGFLNKIYHNNIYKEFGIDFIPHEIMVLNSHANVLRGLHIQKKGGQAKVLSCISGKILVIVVDLRPKSNTFTKYVSFYAEIDKSFYIPPECALGTYAIEDSLMVLGADKQYDPSYDTGIYYRDSSLNINWPIRNEKDIILSQKDKKLQSMVSYLKEVD